MRINYLHIIPFIFSLTIISSCEEAVDWELQSQETERLVVDAIITDQFSIQEIKLAKSFNNLGDSITPIISAEVFVLSAGNSYSFSLADSSKGIYRSDNEFAAILGQEYTLQIDWDGEVYEAKAELSSVLPIPLMEFDIDLTGQFYIIKVAEPYAVNEQAMYHLNLDWKEIDSDTISKQALLHFYTFNTVDVSRSLSSNIRDFRFPKGTVVIENKYGLTESFADYLRTSQLQTSWQGGVFDETAANLNSNVSNDGLGYFAVCAVLSDTIVVE